MDTALHRLERHAPSAGDGGTGDHGLSVEVGPAWRQRSTQNQALSAMLYLYEVVLGRRVEWMTELVRAQRPRLPVVLTRDEVARVLSRLHGPARLMASLMYGAGFRLLECAELRVKDLHLERGEVIICDGKGQ
jgi:integrase